MKKIIDRGKYKMIIKNKGGKMKKRRESIIKKLKRKGIGIEAMTKGELKAVKHEKK